MRQQVNEVCKCCGHKIKKCSQCGVVQTADNSIITKGHFSSTCKSCTAKRVIKIKYDKMQTVELQALLNKHTSVVEQLTIYLSDRLRREDVEIDD